MWPSCKITTQPLRYSNCDSCRFKVIKLFIFTTLDFFVTTSLLEIFGVFQKVVGDVVNEIFQALFQGASRRGSHRVLDR